MWKNLKKKLFQIFFLKVVHPSFYSTPNKCLGTVFTFHVTQPKKKVPPVGGFDPHWVVWFHTGLAKYNIDKGVQNCYFRGTKYSI